MRAWLMQPRTGGVLLLAAVLAVLPLLFPNRYYTDVAVNAGVNALVVVGLNLLIGYAGQISLGHAGFFGIGAYASAVLPTHLGVPPLAAVAVGAAATAALAFVVGRPILRLKGHYLAMATLGLGLLIAMIATNERQWTGGPDGMPVPRIAIGELRLRGAETWYAIVAALLVVGVWLALNLIESPTGRAWRALHDSEVAAMTLGIDVARYKLVAFVVSAVYASVAGSAIAAYTAFVSPQKAGFLHSIEMVTMAVLGGIASVFGGVVGAVALTVLPQALTVLKDYEHAVFGLVLILCMIFMRDGLVPSLLATWRRRAPRGGG